MAEQRYQAVLSVIKDGRIVADGRPMEVIADESRWRACNLRPTSLMAANLRHGEPGDGFLDAETLARRVAQRDSRPADRAEGGSGVDRH